MNDKWEEGYQAYQDGLEPQDNPYVEQGLFSDDYCDWQTGWECASVDAE